MITLRTPAEIVKNHFTCQCRCITTRLRGYAKAVLFGVTSKNVTRLQRVQNAAPRVVVWGSNRRSTNSSNLLEQLHWLHIEWRIKFKIACITYKTASTTQPAYLHSLLKHYVPSRTCALLAPIYYSSPVSAQVLGLAVNGSFSVAAPIIWNSLPLDIRNSSTISCFRRQLKTFFYKAAFRPPSCLIPSQPSASDSADKSPTLCALQIHSLTHLLTCIVKIARRLATIMRVQ